MKAPTKATEPSKDEMPEPIDDAVETTPAPTADVETGADEQEPAQAAPLRRLFESDRERIVRLAREKRNLEEGIGAAEEAVEAEAPADGAQGEPAPVEAPPAPQTLSDDAEIELVVYGVPVKKKLSELKADAQKLLAADQKLEEAKRTAEEARNLLKSAQSRRGQDPDEADQPEGDGDLDTRPKSKATTADQPDIDLADADIDSIVERIQIGDKEEGRSAVTDLVRILAKGNTSRLDERKVADIAAEVNTRTEIKKEIDTALEKFNATFPAIVKDDELVDVAVRRVHKELQADLKAAGLSDDDLSKITNPGDLARMHGEIRRKGGTKLRSYDAVLTAVGTHLQTKFGAALKTEDGDTPTTTQKPTQSAPQETTKVQQRVEMKRSVPQQPRAAGAKAPGQGTAPPPKTPGQYVQELRKLRRFQ